MGIIIQIVISYWVPANPAALQTTSDLLIKTGFGVLVGLFGGKIIE